MFFTLFVGVFLESFMAVNDKIRMMRELHQWSQEDMAERMNMSVNGYAKIERGETKLHLDKLEKIAQVFDIDVLELMATDNGLVCLVNESGHLLHNSTYYGSSEQLSHEIEKLKLQLSHQTDILNQKNALLSQKDNEINALKDVVALLKENKK